MFSSKLVVKVHDLSVKEEIIVGINQINYRENFNFLLTQIFE